MPEGEPRIACNFELNFKNMDGNDDIETDDVADLNYTMKKWKKYYKKRNLIYDWQLI